MNASVNGGCHVEGAQSCWAATRQGLGAAFPEDRWKRKAPGGDCRGIFKQRSGVEGRVGGD